ncbi:hypothetical protein SAMN05216308_104194 [Nitrosospira sp. Nsp13]|nr:hypothetical protein SAMN05216308_104194 [Nitrosospira sp. Nsp13]
MGISRLLRLPAAHLSMEIRLMILDTLFHGDRHRCRNYLHILQPLFLASVKLLFISRINDGNETCFSKKRV